MKANFRIGYRKTLGREKAHNLLASLNIRYQLRKGRMSEAGTYVLLARVQDEWLA